MNEFSNLKSVFGSVLKCKWVGCGMGSGVGKICGKG